MERIYGVISLRDVEKFAPLSEVRPGAKLLGSEWFKFLRVVSSKEECISFLEEDEFMQGIVVSIIKKEVIWMKRN